MVFPLVGSRFSPDMTPDQLEQWLLQEYGEAYEHEIRKLKGKANYMYIMIYSRT